MAPLVYIANYAGHDYSNAERWGELRYITKGYVSFQSLDRVKYDIAEALKETTKDDYLCLSGTLAISVLAALIWYIMHGQVKLLIFDAQHTDYRELLITDDNVSRMVKVINDGT